MTSVLSSEQLDETGKPIFPIPYEQISEDKQHLKKINSSFQVLFLLLPLYLLSCRFFAKSCKTQVDCLALDLLVILTFALTKVGQFTYVCVITVANYQDYTGPCFDVSTSSPLVVVITFEDPIAACLASGIEKELYYQLDEFHANLTKLGYFLSLE